MFYTYILISLRDGQLYIGYTPDLKERLKAHNGGFVKSTKHRRPLTLIHYETFLTDEDALRREAYLKGGNGHSEMKVLLRNTFRKVGYKYY